MLSFLSRGTLYVQVSSESCIIKYLSWAKIVETDVMSKRFVLNCIYLVFLLIDFNEKVDRERPSFSVNLIYI